MKALLVNPRKNPEIVEIENTLEAKQKMVGGLIEVVIPANHPDDVCLICNEEGKLLNLEPNRFLRLEDGTPYDIVAGPFLVVRAPYESDDFDDLTDDQIRYYKSLYAVS